MGMPALEQLLLHHNALQGPLPSATSWRSMVQLALSYNKFDGEVPRGWCQGPSAMGKLIYLSAG